jgi:outer membrane protein insertion porin family
MKLHSLALLLSIGYCVFAQTPKPRKPAPPPAAPQHAEGAPWPIETLAVSGNQNFTSQQVLAAAGLKVGQIAGKDDFEAARQKLLDTGVFDRAGYRFAPAQDNKGYDATLEVVEMPQMYPLRFEDLPATDARLREFLKQKDPLFAPRVPATKPELDRYVRWITEFLAQQNYHETIVAKVTSENTPDLTILIRPAKPRAAIARVKFTNTGTIPPGLLQTAMYGVAVGIGYTEPQMRMLLDSSARPVYEAHGMIRVAFPKIETTPAKDVDGIEVTVQVEPGPVYKLGRVTFSGTDMTAKELTKLASLKPDQTANFDDVKTAQEKIGQHLRRMGYLQARSEVKRKPNDSALVVDLAFLIDPGPRFTFHELTVVGLDIESEPEVRKLWGLMPGKPFNIDYPDHFLERIKEMGLFDNLKSARSESKVNPKDNSVDVTLYFNK